MQRLQAPRFSKNSDVRIPGEFEPQDSIVFGCGQLVRYYPQTFVDLIQLLYGRVKLFGVVSPSLVRLAEVLLGTAGLPREAVTFLPQQTSSMWVRDFSPIGALDRRGQRVFLKFSHSHMRNRDDEGMAKLFSEHFPGRTRRISVALEGGNVISNGAGLVVSSKTIISQNSTRMNHAELAEVLDKEGGVAQWACATPLNGERTGHIDLLATFFNPNLLAVAECDSREDPNNASILNDLADAMSGLKTGAGSLDVVRMPMPYSGDSYYRSYNNVIFANGLVVVPTYPGVDPKQDRNALSKIAEWMPGWEVRGLDCHEVSKKGGSLHCLTMNVPSISIMEHVKGLEVSAPPEILPR